MTRAERQQIWAVYESACELPAPDRAAFVKVSLTEEHLRAKALELLASADAPLDSPPIESEQPAERRWERLGQSLGRFEILAPVGRGGMGEVYEALDPELGRHVAIKCIASKRLGAASAVAAFIREARAASALNHPGVVTVFEVVRTSDTVAIVMELVRGDALRKLTGTPQHLPDVANWGQRIAEALAATHAHGLIHRDIKPENLILRGDGYIKILDFGLAAELASSANAAPMGTLRYMSPEQGRTSKLTPATDIFSLGVVLYELATGVHPFAPGGQNNSTLTVARSAATEDARPPSSVVRRLPAAFDALILQMLEKDPTARPTAEQVAERLALLPRGGKRRGRVIATAAAVAALALYGLLARFVLRPAQVAEIPGTLLTGSPGREGEPAFSPDGKSLAYAWDGGSGVKRDIYVKSISEGDPVRLTTTPEDEGTPVWSPDGKTIAFLREEPASYLVVTVPATGSPERVVTTIHLGQTNILQRLAWLSPSELAVADVKPGKSGGLQLYRVVPASGVRELLLAPHEKDAGTDQDPRLSPDGRWLAFARVLGNSAELRVCSAGGGDSRLLATVSGVQGIAWTADSKRIVYYTFEPPGLRDLWQVAPTGGASARASLSFEAGSVDLALSPDGRRAAYVRHTRDTNLWQVFADGASPQKVIASTRADEDGAFSPDGSKIAFSSDRSGVYEIWVADGNGSNARRVTSLDAFSASPMWSPDGRRLAFDSNGNGETRVWTVPADGGAAKALVDESFDAWVPSWSRDGKWIYFCTRKSGSTQIWRAPSDGGTAVRITGKGGFETRESPDGKFLYYSKGDANGIWRLQLDKPGAAEEKFAAFDQALQFRCWDMGATGVFLAPPGGRPRIELMPFSRGSPEFAAFLPVDLPNAGRCLSAHPDGRSFLYPSLDADRQEIYIADLKGR